MSGMKARMAQAAERSKKRRLHLEAEARERGVVDVDGYVRAVLEQEHGPHVEDMPDDPFLPTGQSLH